MRSRCSQWTSGSWWRGPGFLPFFRALPRCCICTQSRIPISATLRVRAVPDESLSQGSLEIRTKTWGTGRARFTLSFRGQICVQSEEELAGENCFAWTVPQPVLWSAEDPALYDLLIEVYGRDGGAL